MKNKRWKRIAKRLKGKSNNELNCFFCDLFETECFSACTSKLRTLELKIKNSNKDKNKKTTEEKKKFDVSIYNKKRISEDSVVENKDSSEVIFNEYLTEDELDEMLAMIMNRQKQNSYRQFVLTEDSCTIYVEE